MLSHQKGFSLIESAIALVIIGLLMGGMLKSQELITGARVRNLVSQHDKIRAAYFGFLDRYRALPGDYSAARVSIPGCGTCENGNGNGQILTNGAAILESVAAWEHLSKAGFIEDKFVYAAGDAVSPANTPANLYGSPMQLIYDNNYSDSSGITTNRNNLKTGNHLPSDVLAEIDRKVDDGRAIGGQIRYSNYGSAAAIAICTIASGAWNAAAPEPNCGAVSLL